MTPSEYYADLWRRYNDLVRLHAEHLSKGTQASYLGEELDSVCKELNAFEEIRDYNSELPRANKRNLNWDDWLIIILILLAFFILLLLAKSYHIQS